jgi:serine O-acetyltransferase
MSGRSEGAVSHGAGAMIVYPLTHWSRRWRLVAPEMIFIKLNTVFCTCIIGRGAEFGPGIVLNHATAILINGNVRGGSNASSHHRRGVPAKPRPGQQRVSGRGGQGPEMLGDDKR